MVDVTLDFIRILKTKDVGAVKYLCMDNGGKNISLKNKLLKIGFEVQVNLILHNTPEQNGQVERSFATLLGQVRAMSNNSGVGEDLWNDLWAECAATATKLCNVTSRGDGRSPFEVFMARGQSILKISESL
jgi:hypothetical protein